MSAVDEQEGVAGRVIDDDMRDRITSAISDAYLEGWKAGVEVGRHQAQVERQRDTYAGIMAEHAVKHLVGECR